MIFRQLFDPASSTYTYLLADPVSREALIIDPVREQVERDIALIEELALTLRYALETHVHADHVTGAGLLRRRLGCRTAVSAAGPACADVPLVDGDSIRVGSLTLEARATPGHTDTCMTYVSADRTLAFTGDALLIRGCGRTDFQQGDPRRLYRSVHDRILSLPDETLLYPGHDYRGRTVTTVAEEKAHNPRLGAGRREDEFVEIMNHLGLAPPKKMDVAVPANLECGIVADDGATLGPAPTESWAPVLRTATGVPEVPARWLAEHADGVRVVDVRETAELTEGVIAGAEHVPLASLLATAGGWERGAALVLVCRSGGRSGRAAIDLERAGFRRVASLAGGMAGWTA